MHMSMAFPACSFLNGRRLRSEEDALVREGDEVSFGCTRTIEKDGKPWPNPFVFKIQGVQGLLDGFGTATQELEPAAALPHAAADAAAPAAQQTADDNMTPVQEEVHPFLKQWQGPGDGAGSSRDSRCSAAAAAAAGTSASNPQKAAWWT